MSQLADAFGEDFADELNKEKAKRAQERNQVSDEELDIIADKVINQGAFDGSEPMFSYTSEKGVTNHVVLMQLPEPSGDKDIWGFVNKLSTGAVTCPLDYMGNWWSCLFNNPDDLEKLNEGDFAIVIGELDQWENDKGEMNDQISPVRGLLTPAEAKKRADGKMDDAGFGGETEEEPEQVDVGEPDEEENEPEPEPEEEEEDDTEDEIEDDSEEDDSDDGGNLFGGSSDEDDSEEEEEDELPEEGIRRGVDKLAAQHEEIWDTAGNEQRINKVANIVAREHEKIDEDSVDISEVEETVEQYIISESEDEEKDDDDEKLF